MCGADQALLALPPCHPAMHQQKSNEWREGGREGGSCKSRDITTLQLFSAPFVFHVWPCGRSPQPLPHVAKPQRRCKGKRGEGEGGDLFILINDSSTFSNEQHHLLIKGEGSERGRGAAVADGGACSHTQRHLGGKLDNPVNSRKELWSALLSSPRLSPLARN